MNALLPMDLQTVQLMLWEGFAFTIVYSCFCRFTHTNKKNTVRAIRWSFQLLGAVAVVCLVAPLYAWHPDGLTLVLLGVMAVTQVTTAHHWRSGVPRQFQPKE